jgi:hypothetical protein
LWAHPELSGPLYGSLPSRRLWAAAQVGCGWTVTAVIDGDRLVADASGSSTGPTMARERWPTWQPWEDVDER